jgi:hypothetical protein
MKQASAVYVVGIIVVVALIIIFAPILFIWAINTLFNAGIAYSLKTWAASLIIGGVIGSRGSSSQK